MTSLEIGLILLGTLAGFLLAVLIMQGRAQSRAEADAHRMRGVEKQLAARDGDLSGARSETAAALAERDSLRAENSALTAKVGELAAQFDESQCANLDLEDRLNAAEARLLSSDAAVEQDKLDLARWSTAYAQLKLQFARLSGEQVDALERQARLEQELLVRRVELEELVSRLDALQAAQHYQLDVRTPDAAALQKTMTAVSLARSEAELALRRRDLELTELRGELTAMRYSVNILTSSAAELAAMVSRQQSEGEMGDEAEFEPPAPAAPLPPAAREAASAGEELAGLHGIIRDWFGEIQESIPYDATTLLQFGGATNEDRYDQAPATIDIEREAGDLAAREGAGPFLLPRRTADLPPSLLLAAIKASASSALERSVNRQFELAQDLARNRADLDRLAVQVNAWRSMLQITVADEADVLHLLDEMHDATTGEMLAACATVALTAYQKKQDALKRLKLTTASSAAPQPAPADAPAREWRPALLRRS